MALAGGGEASVWWLARGEDRLPGDLRWLTAAEADHAEGLSFTKRRTEYLLRRLSAKHAVAAVLGLPPGRETLARIEVRNQPTGAPYVLLDADPCGLTVSLSDRAGWAVCLVTRHRLVIGCDLELVEPRSPGFVADFLTPAERDYVAAEPDDDARAVAANLVWSAKESALKVLQTGLRRDTRSVEVTIHGVRTADWAAMAIRTAEGVTMPGWWRRSGSFLFTVAADQPVGPPAALERTDPLGDAVPRHSWLDEPVTAPPAGCGPTAAGGVAPHGAVS
jgi:4'-phosphopantetheinyl transferase